MEFTRNNLFRNRFLLLLLCAFSTSLFLQSQTINLISFNNTAIYSSGSSVSIVMNPTGVFEMTNQFVLELSGVNGNWTTPTVLKTLDEFYTPVVNGTLPAALVSGNYKLRIRSTLPELIVESGSFSVTSTASLPTFPTFKSNISNGSSYFNCLDECSSVNNIFGQLQAAYSATTNFSEAQRTCTICNFNSITSSYFARLISIQNSSVRNLDITTDGTFVIPNDLTIGTYVIEIESKNSSGVSSIYSNIFIFQGSGTSFGNANGILRPYSRC